MDSVSTHITRRILLALFLGCLFLLVFFVLQPFLVPVAWAGVLVYVTWPLYLRLRQKLKGRVALSASLMTLSLALVLILPVAWILILVRGEAAEIYQKISVPLNQGNFVLAPELRSIPWIGNELGTFFDRLNADPLALKAQLKVGSDYVINHAGDWAGGVGRNLAKLGLALFTAFFFYRDGEAFVLQIREILHQVLGPRIDGYLAAMGATARAVVYGIVLTALAQGFLAGIGYAVAGTANPMFLAAITTMAAMIPFGTPFAWGAVCVWLFLEGHTWAAIGLTLWGVLVVSWIDNIIRPLVISSATQIPFLLVMFGVLGGLAAFGMIGLFMGPVILAVMIAVWREWLQEARNTESTPAQ
jgi:predicted PurR-regulated permease PerM